MRQSNERRRAPRAETAVRIESLSGGPWMMAHDLSVGGMLVTTSQPRWPGQHIRVRFTLPGDARAICATCRVVDLVEAPRGVGLSLRFLQLADDAQDAVARYLVRCGRHLRAVEPV